MTSESKRIKQLRRSVKELYLDLEAITAEHDNYQFGDGWFSSLPIETLKDSLDRQLGKPRQKPALGDLKHKYGLRRLHEQTSNQLLKANSELRIAEIDGLLEKIGKLVV